MTSISRSQRIPIAVSKFVQRFITNFIYGFWLLGNYLLPLSCLSFESLLLYKMLFMPLTLPEPVRGSGFMGCVQRVDPIHVSSSGSFTRS